MDNNQNSQESGWPLFLALLWFTVTFSYPAWSLRDCFSWWLCGIWLIPVAFAAVCWSLILYAAIKPMAAVLLILFRAWFRAPVP